MDARIILGAQQPDYVNVLAQSNQAAQQRLDFKRQNALAQTIQRNGPGIMAGDPSALNALARHDPQAALGVQSTRLGMDAQRQDMQFGAERMQMARDEAKRAASAQIAAQQGQMTAQQLAADEKTLTDALSGAGMAYQAGDRAGYDAFLAQRGLDPAEYPFDQYPMIAASVGGVLEAMSEAKKAFGSQAPGVPAGFAALQMRAEEAGLVKGTPEYQNFMMTEGKQSNGMAITTNPDGTMTFAQGPGVTGKPLTEQQSKDNVYATRATGALEVLDPVADNLTSRVGQITEAVPFGLARGLQTDDYQVAVNGGNEFLQAILRKDTGAAITEGEQRMYGDTFLPRPGDGAAVLEAKRAARARALEALRAGMDMRQIAMTEAALIKAAERVAAPAAGSSSPPAVGGTQQLSPEAQSVFEKYRAKPDAGGAPATSP